MNEVLRAAMTAHQGGQLVEAARLYQEVLAQEAGNADALHMFGVLCHQQGDNKRAIELTGRAKETWCKPSPRTGRPYACSPVSRCRSRGWQRRCAASCLTPTLKQ
jgi:hypothetical protein